MFINKDLQPSLTFASLHYENIYIRLVGFYEYKMITKENEIKLAVKNKTS